MVISKHKFALSHILAPLIVFGASLWLSLFAFKKIGSEAFGGEVGVLLKVFSGNLVIRLVICTIFSFILMRKIIKKTSTNYLNGGNIYLDVNFFLLVCSYYLTGEKRLGLKNIPIWVQFRIILSNIVRFDIVSEKMLPEDKTEVTCEQVIKASTNETEINIVISDTYYALKKSSESLNGLNTWHIDRHSVDGVRQYNEQIVTNLVKLQRELENQYLTANLFLTTTPEMTKAIVEKCFNLAGRDGFKHINVFESPAPNFKFSKKHKIF